MSPIYNAPQGPRLNWPGKEAHFFGSITPPPYGNGITEVGEVVVAGEKSICVTVPAMVGGRPMTGKIITWSTEFPSAPAAVSISLQSGMRDVEAEYVPIDTTTAVGGERRQIADNGIFYRAIINSISGGTNPTVIAKMRCL